MNRAFFKTFFKLFHFGVNYSFLALYINLRSMEEQGDFVEASALAYGLKNVMYTYI